MTIDKQTLDNRCKTKDTRHKTKDIRQWTQDKNNGHKTTTMDTRHGYLIMYKRPLLRHCTADRRPWTHFTQDIWDTGSEEKTIR